MSTAVGKKLRQAREARKLSLEQAAQTTHIRQRYLQAMEAGDFNALPSSVQVKGFLRAYADLLNLESAPLIEAVERDPLMALVAPQKNSPSEQTEETSPPGDSEASFISVGQMLKTRRELLGFSIEDVEQHTHLRIHYLKALESGNLDGLPSPVQGRGMLKNYADFLGLDSDRVLLRFADGLQARRLERNPSPPRQQNIL
jgi:cytoskeletal protein RodZ